MGNALTDYCLVQVVVRRFPAGKVVKSDDLYHTHLTKPDDFEDYLAEATAAVLNNQSVGVLPLAAPVGDLSEYCVPTRELLGFYFEAVGTHPSSWIASPLDDDTSAYGWLDILREGDVAEMVEDALVLLEANPDSDGVHMLTVWCFHVDSFQDFESSYPEIDSWAEYLGPFDDRNLKSMVVQTKEYE